MSLNNFVYLTILFGPLISIGQNDPIKWEVVYGETKSEIIVTANIDKGWHIYSQNTSPEVGPIATTLSFPVGKDYELSGKPIEEGAKVEFDKMFDAKVGSFENKATFRQEIKRKTPKGFQSPVKVEYTACNSSQCFPAKIVELIVVVPEKK
jgi:hypothetical protein